MTLALPRFWIFPWLLICGLSFYALPRDAALASCLLAGLMLAIAVADADRFIIPDVYSLPAIPLGLLATACLAPAQSAHVLVLYHLLAAAVLASCLYGIAVAYQWWRGQEGLGLGDVKLAAVAGAWCGIDGGGDVVLLASIAALAMVLLARSFGGRMVTRDTELPFGAFLAPSIWLVWVWSQITGPTIF